MNLRSGLYDVSFFVWNELYRTELYNIIFNTVSRWSIYFDQQEINRNLDQELRQGLEQGLQQSNLELNLRQNFLEQGINKTLWSKASTTLSTWSKTVSTQLRWTRNFNTWISGIGTSTETSTD